MLSLALACGVISFAVGMLFVPAVRWVAQRIGIVDRPDPTRKLHRNAIALGGGLAVFAASVFAVLVTLFLIAPRYWNYEFALDTKWSTLLFCCASIVLLGLIDDWLVLRGRQKLLGQIMIVCMLVGGSMLSDGTVVNRIEFFGFPLELGIFALPLTMLWLLGSINALNLIDGADGIASTVGSVICFGLAANAFSRGDVVEGCVSIALAGSLLAFLRFNKPPASIFLGDSGSMLIGLVVGTLAIWTSTKESMAVAVFIPIAVLSIPLFDSSIAILRRLLTGRSIYAADRAHLHHVLKAYIDAKGYSQTWMLVVVAVLTLIPVAGATASVVLGEPLIAFVVTIFVLGGMVVTKSFGHAELSLLARKSMRFGTSMVTRSHRAEGQARQTAVRLQGTRDWDLVWESLVDFADQHGLWKVKLDLSVSWLHEGFHGDWQRSRLPERADQWSIRLPITVGDRNLGSLSAIGRGGGPDTYELLEKMCELIVDLHPRIEAIVNSNAPSASESPVAAPTKAAEPAMSEHPVPTSDRGKPPTSLVSHTP